MVGSVAFEAEDITLAEPMFRVISAAIARQITAGEIAPGARLLSERELCKRFGVSRDTIRRALAELRQRGLLEPDGMRGWYVTASLGEPNRLMGFSDMARARGLVPGSRVLAARLRPASLDEAEELGVAPGTELFELERIRLLDGAAVAHETSLIVHGLAPGIAAGDYVTGSLYDALRRAGAAPYSSDYVLQALAADGGEASLLGVAPGFPMLLATATTSTQQGRRIELSRSLFRGDRYRFRTTLLAPAARRP